MATLDELLDDITKRIVEADPAIAPRRVREAAAGVLAKPAHADRLLAALVADPTLLVSGSAQMPRALQRIIVAIDVPHSAVRLPRCPSCERELAAAFVNVGDLRLCGTCAKRATRRFHSCAECGNSVLNPRRAAGRAFCLRCWNSMRSRRSAILLTVLRRAIPELAASVIDDGLLAASASETEQLRLTLDCVENSTVWLAQPAQGNAAFARLYAVLTEHYPQLRPLVCAVCQSGGPLTNVLDGTRVCARCYRNGRRQDCDRCHQPRTISRQLADGTKLCQWCWKSDPEQIAECTVCGQRRVVAAVGPTGAVCGSCRLMSAVDTCSKCGRVEPCRFAGTARAVCEGCRRKRVPCARCGTIRLVHTRDEAGDPLCGSCSHRPTETCVSCGQFRSVVGRVHGEPLCGTCFTKHPASFRDCTRCGSHRKLRQTGLCDRCTIIDLATEMLPASVFEAHPSAVALRDALLGGGDAQTVAAFLRPRSLPLLRKALAEPGPITHTAIDALGPEQATRHVRALLVQYGLLPAVDYHLQRFERWIPEAVQTISEPVARSAFTQYANWKHLRELRAKQGPISGSLAGSRRRELRIVTDLLTWIEREGTSLEQLTQGQVDHWSTTGPERHRVQGFLRWARRNRLARDLSVFRAHPPPPTIGGLSDEERQRLLADVLRNDAILAGTRLAAALVLLYGIRPHRIAQITLDQVDSIDRLARIRIGADHLYLPDELGIVTEAVIAARTARRLLHDVHDGVWLLPGTRPGYPIANTTLTRRLREIGVAIAPARRGALTSLASQLHPVVLADLTGIHIRTAIVWRDAVAASRARYVAERL